MVRQADLSNFTRLIVWSEVDRVGAVECVFTGGLERDLRPQNSRMPYYANYPASRSEIGPLRWQFSIKSEDVTAEVLLKGTSVGRCTFRLETERTASRRLSAQSWEE